MDLSAFNLQGRVALITGGAHGIGFSIAEGMAQCGATVCFNCSSEASLRKVLPPTRPPASTPTAMLPTCPTRTLSTPWWQRSRPRWALVDILVNNAGLMKRGAHDRDEATRISYGSSMSMWAVPSTAQEQQYVTIISSNKTCRAPDRQIVVNTLVVFHHVPTAWCREQRAELNNGIIRHIVLVLHALLIRLLYYVFQN